ncbi:MAG: TIGR03905 family TSCPD domain-containing protein [Ruminococcus sp.]|nr:TIGR03905 family TSCPD domain-containing protein [Ruminococcus sp.]
MKRISYKTRGTCSTQIDIEVEGDIVKKVIFTGGCHGNTQGVAKLVEGMKVEDVIEKLEGINCRGRGTSCPDQLSKALKMFVSKS